MNSNLAWQRIAMELLRRLAKAPPTISIEQLRIEGHAHERELNASRLDTAYLALCDPEDPRQRLYRAIREVQVRATLEALRELRGRGVEPLVLKSIEIGARYQMPQIVGVCRDVDLLVPATALWTVEKVMYGLGYARSEFTDTGWREMNPREGYRLQATGYELAPFVKAIRIGELDEAQRAHAAQFPQLCRVQEDGVLAICKFDLHHNLLFNFDVTALFDRRVPSAVGEGHTLSPADHLWFLIHRYYYEVAMGLQTNARFFPTIASALTAPDLDWSVLIEDAVNLRAAAPCLYWLAFFRRLGAPSVDARVLDELRSHMAGSEYNFGWQLGRLFGFEEAFPEHLLA